jgi:hypothetical protein
VSVMLTPSVTKKRATANEVFTILRRITNFFPGDSQFVRCAPTSRDIGKGAYRRNQFRDNHDNRINDYGFLVSQRHLPSLHRG